MQFKNCTSVTAKEIKRMAAREGHCLRCGSDQIDYTDRESDDDWLTWDAKCLDCGMFYCEVHLHKFDHCVVRPENGDDFVRVSSPTTQGETQRLETVVAGLVNAINCVLDSWESGDRDGLACEIDTMRIVKEQVQRDLDQTNLPSTGSKATSITPSRPVSISSRSGTTTTAPRSSLSTELGGCKTTSPEKDPPARDVNKNGGDRK